MKDQIKKLYEEAANLHSQAKALLAKWAGKEMPADQRTQIDALLDQVEAKSAEAKRLERVEEQEKFLNEPMTRKDFYTEKKTDKSAEPNVDYKRAMKQYLRHGRDGLSRDQVDLLAKGPTYRIEESDGEFKDLSVGTPTAGGYLVTDTFLSELIRLAREMSAMRRIARVLPPVPAGSVIAPSEDTDLSDATWTTEILTGSADTVAPFGQRKLTPHSLAKRVLVSNDLLRNPGFDVEVYVRDAMAYRFAVPEEEGFVNGTGVNRPLGVLQTASLPTYTTAVAITLTADDVINWLFSLPAAYASNARILCNRSFIRRVRLLKDGTGNYIWAPGLASGTPNQILDTPYDLSDRVATGLSGTAWVTGSVVAVVGDFRYYWIVDALGMEIQRLVELYAASNQVGFIGRKAADGMAVRYQAFYSLTIQ